jgi:DNA-binding LacI/PurR family transcriptional regulator
MVRELEHGTDDAAGSVPFNILLLRILSRASSISLNAPPFEVDGLVCGNDVMAIGARDAAVRLLGRQVPGDLAIVGQDGIAMAGWECHDPTTLVLDQVAFIDAIVGLIEPHETSNGAASTTVVAYTVRWGSTA